MKTIYKVLLATVVMLMFATPVFAQEVTDPHKVIKEETFVAGEDSLAREFHNSEIWRSENYVKYLDGVIYNLNETVRIKKEIVTNYTWLSQFNPYYATLIPTAEKDLAEAEAWVAYYKDYKTLVHADLKMRYNYD